MEFSADSFSAGEWIFFTATVFGAFVLRGFVGLGSSALCVSLFTFIMPPSAAVPLILMLEIPASILLLPDARRHADIKWLTPTVIGVFIGTPAGLWLLSVLPEKTAQVCVYALVAFFVCANFLRRENSLLFAAPPFAVGVVAGAANGVAAVAGMVVAAFLLASSRSPQTVRASVNLLFFFSDFYGLLWGVGLGLLGFAHGFLFLAALPPLVAGVALGAKLFSRSGGKRYRPLVLGIIFFICATGFLRLLFAADK
ncbi:MAG: sulfite exporter TauE/SafE family protein [Gammaproteobacteria bacterium]